MLPNVALDFLSFDWYRIFAYAQDDNGHCRHCCSAVAGHYGKFGKPFGPQRIPVRLHTD